VDISSEMLGFVGEEERSIDSQGRIAIPKEWRLIIQDSPLYLLPVDGILQVATNKGFAAFMEKARQISLTDPQGARALAMFGSRAQQCRCDAQGRIQINQKLLDYASLKESVIMVGAIATMQVWNKAKWQKQQEQLPEESVYEVVNKIHNSPGNLENALKQVLGK